MESELLTPNRVNDFVRPRDIRLVRRDAQKNTKRELAQLERL